MSILCSAASVPSRSFVLSSPHWNLSKQIPTNLFTPDCGMSVAALFRCTLYPEVLQSRNLETSIPRDNRPSSEQHVAHAARRFRNSNTRFISSATALCQCLVFLKHVLVFARKMEGSNEFPPHHFANV
ncbi:hypothetical protein BU25DRAFT_254745 [Macroventuria anomochaeta]|uniref:Uncharacterized protein n=1 Tax=Macroventuria anomochaeta TaxID=301207 RepID=A0ACB6S9N5_9PLEO|nr:uncharacterized protein BU25DRAFT_254745 [Macroventuria anomochaeta]KAF2630237.1 hypothetical protein BU25DRAFT_254745 [Macroventuria anomochaeta]